MNVNKNNCLPHSAHRTAWTMPEISRRCQAVSRAAESIIIRKERREKKEEETRVYPCRSLTIYLVPGWRRRSYRGSRKRWIWRPLCPISEYSGRSTDCLGVGTMQLSAGLLQLSCGRGYGIGDIIPKPSWCWCEFGSRICMTVSSCNQLQELISDRVLVKRLTREPSMLSIYEAVSNKERREFLARSRGLVQEREVQSQFGP